MQSSQVKALRRSCRGGNEAQAGEYRRKTMIIKAIRTTGLSIALAASFLVAAGGTSAFAQDWRWHDHDRDGWREERRERRDWREDRRERFEDRRDHRFDHDGYRDHRFDHDGY